MFLRAASSPVQVSHWIVILMVIGSEVSDRPLPIWFRNSDLNYLLIELIRLFLEICSLVMRTLTVNSAYYSYPKMPVWRNKFGQKREKLQLQPIYNLEAQLGSLMSNKS